MFTVKQNRSGPGWHVLNAQGKEIAWLFEQGHGHRVCDEERARALCAMLNRTDSFGEADGCEDSSEVKS